MAKKANIHVAVERLRWLTIIILLSFPTRPNLLAKSVSILIRDHSVLPAFSKGNRMWKEIYILYILQDRLRTEVWEGLTYQHYLGPDRKWKEIYELYLLRDRSRTEVWEGLISPPYIEPGGKWKETYELYEYVSILCCLCGLEVA